MACGTLSRSVQDAPPLSGVRGVWLVRLDHAVPSLAACSSGIFSNRAWQWAAGIKLSAVNTPCSRCRLAWLRPCVRNHPITERRTPCHAAAAADAAAAVFFCCQRLVEENKEQQDMLVRLVQRLDDVEAALQALQAERTRKGFLGGFIGPKAVP